MELRADRPLAPAALYALIDGRPTRRETREQNSYDEPATDEG